MERRASRPGRSSTREETKPLSADEPDKGKKHPKVLLDLELKRPRVRPKLPPTEQPPAEKPSLELQLPEREPDPPPEPEDLEELVPDHMRRGFYRSEELVAEDAPPPSIDLGGSPSEPTVEDEVEAVSEPPEPEPEPESTAASEEEQPRWRRWLAPATAAAVCVLLVVGSYFPSEPGPPGPVTLDQIVPAAAVPAEEEVVIEEISPAAQMEPLPTVEEPAPAFEEEIPSPPDDVAALAPPVPVEDAPPAAEPPANLSEDTVIIEEEPVSALPAPPVQTAPAPAPAAPPPPAAAPPPQPPPPAVPGRSSYEIAEPSF